MPRWTKASIVGCAGMSLFLLLVVSVGRILSEPAQLPALDSNDFQLLIFSDNLTYKLGETPHITAQILNRSQRGAYFHNWSPTRPPGLEVLVKRPADALPIDEQSASSCAPTYSGFFRGWGGNVYSSKFTYLPPGAMYSLDPCKQLPQGLFNSPGEYEIHVVYTNETEKFESQLANVGTGNINYTYQTGKQEGTWIAADADEFAAPHYRATERHLAISLGDKGPWVGDDWKRRRVTLREMLDHAPRMTLRSKVLTIRVAGPLPFPKRLNKITLMDYANDFLFPRARFGLPRHQRIVEKLKSLGESAFLALELVISEDISGEDRTYALSFFQLVPGDREIPQRVSRHVIENHLANPPAALDSLRDVVEAVEVLGEFGASEDCGLLIDYLEGNDDSASWVVFSIVKKLANDEMLADFVEVLAQKVGYAHTDSLLDESIFLWGKEVVIEAEMSLLRLTVARSRDPEEQHKLSRAGHALDGMIRNLGAMHEHYESVEPRFKKLVEANARNLLLKKTLTLDQFNEARYLVW